jgi:hypothetical protein
MEGFKGGKILEDFEVKFPVRHWWAYPQGGCHSNDDLTVYPADKLQWIL